MRKLIALAAAAGMLLPTAPASTAGPADGWASENVEYVTFVPFEVGTATGAKVVGKYLYVTSWKSFSIYDVSNPESPELLSITPFGFKFENEDVATNGKVLVFSEQLPAPAVHVWDVEDKENPVKIGELAGAGQHTMECLLDCNWLYGSSGNIVNLKDPANPKLAGKWGEGLPVQGGHDVNEVAPGLVLTSSRPIMVLDARTPTKPKLLAIGDDEAVTGGIHSNRWPRRGKDRWVLFSSETNATGRCTGTNGAFMVWDAKNYKKTKTLTLSDVYQLENGTFQDGAPPVNGLGCSAHWFEEHPTFKNGGLVVAGSYEHGTRFLDITKNGKIEEVGWFVPHAGSTSAAYWMTKELVYSIDYTRGIDVLRFSGK